jgi:hypothetical protein
MGTGTAINFQPTGDGNAAIAGDFVVTADELNPMISALRENGIEVVAIHSHMLQEQPRLFFVHFWANDDALKLANGLQAALSKELEGELSTAPSPEHRCRRYCCPSRDYSRSDDVHADHLHAVGEPHNIKPGW